MTIAVYSSNITGIITNAIASSTPTVSTSIQPRRSLGLGGLCLVIHKNNSSNNTACMRPIQTVAFPPISSVGMRSPKNATPSNNEAAKKSFCN